MRSIATMMVLAAGAVSCGPPPTPKSLPADLLPPEYEKPRGYDLPGGKSAEPAAPTSAGAAVPAPAAPAAPAPPAPVPPKP